MIVGQEKVSGTDKAKWCPKPFASLWLLVKPLNWQSGDLQRIQSRVLTVCKKHVVADEFDRRVTVPSCGIRSYVPDVRPRRTVVAGNGSGEGAATDGFDLRQWVGAIIPNQQQVTRRRYSFDRRW